VKRGGIDLAMTLDLDDPTAPAPREWATLGFNRVSISLAAIAGADLPASRMAGEVARRVECARNAGFANLRIEVPYALPAQSDVAFQSLVAAVTAAEPERVGLRQCRAPEIDDGRAGQSALARMLLAGADALEAAGYLHVGVDLFARPNDPLVLAQRQRRIHRDALGFGAHGATHLVGFGVGAISQLGGCYAQNPLDQASWEARIDRGHRAVDRGVALQGDDLVRAELLQGMLCHGLIETARMEVHHQVDFEAYFADALLRLQPLFADGSLAWSGDAIVLDRLARLASRAIARQFDSHAASPASPPVHAND
jgi:oxygen-independent coproporphyrinogen-3 oxidase